MRRFARRRNPRLSETGCGDPFAPRAATSRFPSRAGFDSLRRVNVNLGIWDKLTKLAIFCLFALGVIAVAVWYLPLIRQNEHMRQDLLKIQTKIKVEQERERSIKVALDAARTNPKTVERLARANLGYAKPGEIVVRFEDPPPKR